MRKDPDSADNGAAREHLQTHISGIDINMISRMVPFLTCAEMNTWDGKGWKPGAENMITFPASVFDQIHEAYSDADSGRDVSDTLRSLYYLNPDNGHAVYWTGSPEISSHSVSVQEKIDAVAYLTAFGNVILVKPDPEENTETELLDRLRREQRPAVVLSLHEPELARAISDRILFLKDGNPVGYGDPRELLGRDSLIRQFVGILPMALFFARTFGLYMVWWSFPLAEILGTLYFALMLHHMYKKEFRRMGIAPDEPF